MMVVRLCHALRMPEKSLKSPMRTRSLRMSLANWRSFDRCGIWIALPSD